MTKLELIKKVGLTVKTCAHMLGITRAGLYKKIQDDRITESDKQVIIAKYKELLKKQYADSKDNIQLLKKEL